MFTMHFDVEFSSVSMPSRPPTIGKIAMFWSSCRDDDVAKQVRESSQPITHCKAWQPRAGDAVDKLTVSYVDTMAAISWNYARVCVLLSFILTLTCVHVLLSFIIGPCYRPTVLQ